MLVGLLGKTNVGKSTFFNAATQLNAPVASHPFTTINPNVGIAYARVNCVCREFGVNDNPIHSLCIDGNRFIPVKLIDVAGLVPGAHEGRGLGNKFLDDARQSDALIHVVDASGSTDSEGRTCSAGSQDPLHDVEFVEKEFDMWLSSVIRRDWDKTVREAEHQGQKLEQLLAKRLSGLAISEGDILDVLSKLPKGKKPFSWSKEEIFEFCRALRMKSKPVVIAANKADIPAASQNIEKMKKSGRIVIPCASEAELLLRRAASKGLINYLSGDNSFKIKDGSTLTPEQTKALDLVRALMDRMDSTGVQQVINTTCFELLKMIVVYPVEDDVKLTDKKGNVLPDAYMLRIGSTPKDLAATIHSDLAKGFLHAVDARSKQRLAADHQLKNGDVVRIVSTTSGG
ncbi:MAG: redox-regulated ATPase YchF [Nitrososphaerales archaeon]